MPSITKFTSNSKQNKNYPQPCGRTIGHLILKVLIFGIANIHMVSFFHQLQQLYKMVQDLTDCKSETMIS